MRTAIFLFAVLLAFDAAAGEYQIPTAQQCAEHVAAFEGSWFGKENPAPFGPMDMAFAFHRQEDGSLLALSAQSPRTWLELHFFEEDGAWHLREAAAMEGLGEQSHTMELLGMRDGSFYWDVVEMPGYMTMRTAAREQEIEIEVVLRGQPHVLFKLQRVPGEAGSALAADLAAGAATVVRAADLD